eukprot:5344711-Alexandrium_andersonii.AAC.1
MPIDGVVMHRRLQSGASRPRLTARVTAQPESLGLCGSSCPRCGTPSGFRSWKWTVTDAA